MSASALLLEAERTSRIHEHTPRIKAECLHVEMGCVHQPISHWTSHRSDQRPRRRLHQLVVCHWFVGFENFVFPHRQPELLAFAQGRAGHGSGVLDIAQSVWDEPVLIRSAATLAGSCEVQPNERCAYCAEMTGHQPFESFGCAMISRAQNEKHPREMIDCLHEALPITLTYWTNSPQGLRA